MKHWKVITIGILGLLLFPLLAWATQITIPSAPGSGYFWVSTSTGAAIYTPFSTTSASCSGNTTCSSFTVIGSSPITISSSGGSGSGLSTTTPLSNGNLLVYSTSGAGAAYGVATSTLTPSSPLTGSFVQVGSSGSLGCQTASGSQAGCLSSTDWTTFNNKQAALTFKWPLVNSANTVSDNATTSPWAANQFMYTNSAGLEVTAASSSLDLPNTALQNSSITVTTASPLGGAGTISLGGTLALTCSTCSTTSGANPSGTIGLSAVNGSAATFLRSDGAPALSQAIVPTWTGLHTFSAGLIDNASSTFTVSPIISPLATPAGTFVAANASGQLIATSSPTGTSYWTALGNNIYNNNNGGTGNVYVGTTSTSGGIFVVQNNSETQVSTTSVYSAPGTYNISGCFSGTIYLWGGGGGGGAASGGGGSGGAGAYVTATVSHVCDKSIVVASGGGGSNGSTFGSGGLGFAAGAPGSATAGGGGGSSSYGGFIAAGGGGGGSSSPWGGDPASGTSGGNGVGNGGGGGAATAGSGSTGGTGASTMTGTPGGVNSNNGGGGSSAAGASGNGNTVSSSTGGNGSGGASGGTANNNGTNGSGEDSGGGGGGAGSNNIGGNGGSPGSGGGSSRTSYTAGNGGNGEVILIGTLITVNSPSFAVYASSSSDPQILVNVNSDIVLDLASSALGFLVQSGTTIFQEINVVGHLITGGASPTCGSGCSSIQGDDRTMRITTGSSVTSVVVNFANAWSESPICIPSEESLGDDGMGASTTATTLTITLVSALTTKYIGVLCQSSNNFAF